MATKLFFTDPVTGARYRPGVTETNLRGTTMGFFTKGLTTTAGASLQSIGASTVAGPTAGLEPDQDPWVKGSSRPIIFYSLPLAAAATISGSITWNIWAREANMTDNVAINGQLEVVDGATGAITLIDATARITEVNQSATANTVNNFSETPAAGVACKKGDRLRVRIYGDDLGGTAMGAGGNFTVAYNGPTGAADGDSWMQLTENLTFASEPAGTTIYPTNTASAVATASVDRLAWTSRGAGVQNDPTTITAGYGAPIQVTDTAGGTVVDWFTDALPTSTLSGPVRVNVGAAEANGSSAQDTIDIGCEIARVAGDGTSPTVWGTAYSGAMVQTSTEGVSSFLVSGDDLAITSGQRFRVRFYFDDGVYARPVDTATLYYAGTSGGASGDTYLTFSYDIEAASGGAAPHPHRPKQYPQLLAH